MWNPNEPDKSKLPPPPPPPSNGSRATQEVTQPRPRAEGLPQWDLEPPANVLRRPER